MPDCRFCNAKISEEDKSCPSCGYDPKTDTISPGFVPPSAEEQFKKENRRVLMASGFGVGPGVKKFALIGLAILVFAIFYKNHFSISNVVAEVKYTFTMIAKGKFKPWGDSSSSSKKIEYIDVRTYDDNRR